MAARRLALFYLPETEKSKVISIYVNVLTIHVRIKQMCFIILKKKKKKEEEIAMTRNDDIKASACSDDRNMDTITDIEVTLLQTIKRHQFYNVGPVPNAQFRRNLLTHY